MKLLKAVLSLLSLLLLAESSRGSALRYMPYKLFELASVADLVVAGTIRDIRPGPPRAWFPWNSPERFRLEIEKVIVGIPPSDSLQVACFQNWACASRWAKYAPGQRVLLFLAAPAPGSKSYRILSGGGEGEMPLLGETVIARGYRIEGHDGCRIEDHLAVWPRIDGVEVIGALVPLVEFGEAVRGVRETYAFALEPRSLWIRSIRPKHSLKQAEEFAARSKLAKHMHHEATTSRAWKQ